MSQNTHVAKRRFVILRREIKGISRSNATPSSSFEWQLSRYRKLEVQARGVTAVMVWSACFAIGGCSVYDSSLLEPASLADAAGGDTGRLILPSSGGAEPAVASASGGVSSGGDSSSQAGTDSAGSSPASAGGSDTSGGAGGALAVTGGSASGGSGAGELGGGAAGAAVNLTLSLIDDMENTDPYIPNVDGRQGFWSLANDGTLGGKQTPSTMVMSSIVGGRGASLAALHTTAAGYKTGAQVGVDLNRKGSSRLPYDASSYNAVRFWSRVEAGSPNVVRLSVLDKHTDPGGGLCCLSASNCTGGGSIVHGLCYDHFAAELPPIGTQWTERTVLLSDLKQAGWGDNKLENLDSSHVFALQFDWLSTTMDLWIDDISFVKK